VRACSIQAIPAVAIVELSGGAASWVENEGMPADAFGVRRIRCFLFELRPHESSMLDIATSRQQYCELTYQRNRTHFPLKNTEYPSSPEFAPLPLLQLQSRASPFHSHPVALDPFSTAGGWGCLEQNKSGFHYCFSKTKNRAPLGKKETDNHMPLKAFAEFYIRAANQFVI